MMTYKGKMIDHVVVYMDDDSCHRLDKSQIRILLDNDNNNQYIEIDEHGRTVFLAIAHITQIEVIYADDESKSSHEL